MGGVQHPRLNKLASGIWQWCEKRNIFIYASYVRSSDNTIADTDARKVNVDTEWELSDSAYSDIIQKFGNPEFDLFASIQNQKCKRYASWKSDPHSEVVDAFTFSWKNLYFYAFPPFSLISKVVQKIIADKAEGILVVPYWRSQPWYPWWSRLIISKKLFLAPINTFCVPLSEHTTRYMQTLSWWLRGYQAIVDRTWSTYQKSRLGLSWHHLLQRL